MIFAVLFPFSLSVSVTTYTRKTLTAPGAPRPCAVKHSRGASGATLPSTLSSSAEYVPPGLPRISKRFRSAAVLAVQVSFPCVVAASQTPVALTMSSNTGSQAPCPSVNVGTLGSARARVVAARYDRPLSLN